MKFFLENIFMCLVTFWKSYFPPPPTQNPPPHNRKTTKTPPPTPPPQQQKNHRSKRESKKSKSQTNFITKISNENENEIGNGFAGSWVRDATRGATILGFLGSTISSLTISPMVWRSWVFWVCNLSLSLSLSLFVCLRKWFEGKILAENIFRVKGLNFTVNWNSFPENPFSMRNQTPAFTEKYFQKWFEAKTNTALYYKFRFYLFYFKNIWILLHKFLGI